MDAARRLSRQFDERELENFELSAREIDRCR
jgi:hypothetical protein